jgi:hypothetical protein
MAVDLNFDANNVPPTSPFDPIPNNSYRSHAVESEVKPTASGSGKYLQITWEVLDGEFKGRKVWQRLNIVNANAQAQEIAQRELSAICHATGVLKLTNSSQLHHIPVMLKVVVKKDGDRDPQNEVKKVSSVDGAKPVVGTASPAASAAVKASPEIPSIAPEKAPAWARAKTA